MATDEQIEVLRKRVNTRTNRAMVAMAINSARTEDDDLRRAIAASLWVRR